MEGAISAHNSSAFIRAQWVQDFIAAVLDLPS